MVLSALATVMIAVPVWVSDVTCIRLRSIPCAREERLQLCAKRILADAADQRRRRAQFGGRDRLVRALAAGKVEHGLARDRFADTRMPVGRRHHIHVDASGNENPAHAISNSSPHAPVANAILTTSMSVSVGKPASLPRRWIL